MAFDFNRFMALVKTCNPNFKRFATTSHLDPVIAELKGKTFISPQHREKLEKLIAFIPFDRQTTYAKALDYLTQNGGVQVGAIPAKPVMKFTQFSYVAGHYDGFNQRGEKKKILLSPDVPESPGPRSFVHTHVLSWSSSNGNNASLQTVRTREWVKFDKDTQAEPFNAIQDPDREFFHPGILGSTGALSGTDDHSTKLPALICCNPRKEGVLKAQQWYQYSVDGGVKWHNIEGAAYEIEKRVKKEGNDWVYIFKKTNWAQHNNKHFHFEVMYTVGAAPEYMPRKDTDVEKIGFAVPCEMKKFARKVVATG